MPPLIEERRFGALPDGTPVRLFTLRSESGLVARLTDYGATITELHVPDGEGRTADVVLGFDTLEGYLGHGFYFGCTVGRVANRIAGGRFRLDGQDYLLACNNGPHHLHGGVRGFDKQVWRAEVPDGSHPAVRLALVSPDGDEGYPGRLEVGLVVSLTPGRELVLEYTAETDRPTPVNLTNHSYFNLAGTGDIRGHLLSTPAGHYLPTTATQVPTGEVAPVAGTPLDFGQPTELGARMVAPGDAPPGYDHTLVLPGRLTEAPRLAARLIDPGSGRVLEMLTTAPAFQLYTGNYLDGSATGKGGARYAPHAGVSLEAQHYPDAVNRPAFPSTILRPGQTYRQTTIYRFGPSGP